MVVASIGFLRLAFSCAVLSALGQGPSQARTGLKTARGPLTARISSVIPAARAGVAAGVLQWRSGQSRAKESVAAVQAALEHASPEEQREAAASFADDAGPPGEDISASLLDIHRQVRNKTALPMPREAYSHTYRVVPGFLSSRSKRHLKDNLARLKALGLDAQVIRINTESDTAGNEPKIKKAVESVPPGVVLFGVSRGGNEVIDTYAKAEPEYKDRIAAMVLIMPPLWGTPIADWIAGSAFKRALARLAGRFYYRADILSTIEELTTQAREKLLGTLPALTAEDKKKIYVITMAVGPNSNHGHYRLGNHIIRKLTGQVNDGRVPVDSAKKVPGAKVAFIPDMNHIQPVQGRGGRLRKFPGFRPHPLYDVGDLTEAIVRQLFK